MKKHLASVLFHCVSLLSVCAANPDGALRVEVLTAYNFIVDSNVETPATYAPRAAYISARIWNDGTTPMENVVAYVGNGTTPGVYNSTTWPGLTGTFSLTHEGGTMGTGDATRSLGTIAPGDYVAVYWLVSYPNLDDVGQTVTGGAKPDDDLVLDYSIWVKGDENGVTPRLARVDRTATMRNCISAMANKIFPNTANKVPQLYQDLLNKYEPDWSSLAADGSPGTSILTEGVWYDLGNVTGGFDNDGDLVPDRNAWLQPVGDPSLLDPSEFRLVNTYALIVVKLKSGGEQVYDVQDQLYFENLPENNGVIGLVRYDFLPLKANSSAQLTPYQMAASGFDNEKFNGDYGAGIGGPQSVASPLTLDKSVVNHTTAQDPGINADAGDRLDYSMEFSNPGTQTVGDPASGAVLVIQDSIPANTTYLRPTASSGNTPPTGLTYELRYSKDGGATWTLGEPVDDTEAALVTDLQWWLSGAFVPGESGTVTFSVTIDSASVAVIPNVAGLSFGDTDPFLTDDVQTLLNGSLTISGTVFLDDGGTTGTYGDGTQDGGEEGIQDVKVSLYYDANNDGQIDTGDTLISTTTSADTTGDYSFTGLPNGNYLVLVDEDDTEITTPGYAPTSPVLRDVTLSGADSTGNDFGFAPTLTLSKTGTVSAKEGDEVVYTVTVTNQYPGAGLVETYTRTGTGATTGTGQAAWTGTPSNGLTVDSAYVVAPYAGSLETLTLSGFATPSGTGTITSVDLIFYAHATANFPAGSTLEIQLLTNGVTSIYTNTTLQASTFNGANYAARVVNIPGTYTWAQLQNLSLVLGARKSANPPGDLSLDAVQIRVTSTETTSLNTVPFTDTYNADQLTFVEATVGGVPTAPDNHPAGSPTRTLTWNNIGPIGSTPPENQKVVVLTFTANELLNNVPLTTTDVASVTGATFNNGNPANNVSDSAETYIFAAGSIGDTIFFDINQNGRQDEGEPGIEDAVVNLYAADGTTLLDTVITDADGLYQFTGLDAGSYVVRPDTTTDPLNVAGLLLTADPETDGEPCLGACDGEHAVTLTQGQTFAGADFGYFLPGGVISGTLWIDFDDDGVVDANEVGLPYITVTLYDSGNNVVATTTTDADGNYSFGGLDDDTYRVVVDNADPDFPSGIGPTFELDDASPNEDGEVATIVVSGGEVTGITAVPAYSGSGENINFGYRYAGNNSLSGTIGMDGASLDGVMGSGNSGVDPADEVAYANVTVYIYLWNDEGTPGTVESGEVTLLGSTTTNTNGDYSFTGLPNGDGNDLYIVSMVPPYGNLSLTTTLGDTPATVLVDNANAAGVTTGAYQAVPVSGAITGMDFAFESLVNYDFGDLPESYSVLLPGGARHIVKDTPDLYLGAGVTTENNGVVSANSSADGNDDGVDFTGIWQNGVLGGEVEVTVTGSGWLVGYVDFNQDGDFSDEGELVVSQAVSGGSATYSFDVPSGTLDVSGSTTLYARFRILPNPPFIPELAFTGEYANGEVEDYQWRFNTISGSVFDDADGGGLFSGGDVPRAGVVVTLYEGGTPVATTVTGLDGAYAFYGVPDGTYTVQMTPPAGSSAVNDQDGSDLTLNGDGTPLVVAGNSVTGQDFLLDNNTTLADISGTVYFDADGSGSLPDPQSDDPGRQGMTVQLYRDINTDGIIDAGEFVGSTTTDANGGYVFNDLPSGNYLILLSDSTGTKVIDDADDGTLGFIGGITLSGSNVTGQDFLLDVSDTPEFCVGMNGTQVEAHFVRPETETGVTYAVQYTDTLGNPTIWEGSVTLTGSNSSESAPSGGLITVTVPDLVGLTGLGGGEGFVRLLRTENGETTASAVGGWVDSQFAAACRTYNNPFLDCPPLRATVVSVSGQDLVLTDSIPVLGAGTYYIEVTAGDYEGHRFDIASFSGSTLTLANDSALCGLSAPLNTLTGPPPSDLAGDTIVLRKHRSLADLFPPAQLGANNDPLFADQVTLHDGSGFVCYFLYDGGAPKWVLVGDPSLTDVGASTLVPPGHGMFYLSRATRTLTAAGQVRENDFVRPLCQGDNLVAGGYPLDQSALNRQMLPSFGFTGNADYTQADKFLRWRGDITVGTTSYDTYYYITWGSRVQWTKFPDYTFQNQNQIYHFLRDQSSVYQMISDLHSHRYPAPWAP